MNSTGSSWGSASSNSARQLSQAWNLHFGSIDKIIEPYSGRTVLADAFIKNIISGSEKSALIDDCTSKYDAQIEALIG